MQSSLASLRELPGLEVHQVRQEAHGNRVADDGLLELRSQSGSTIYAAQVRKNVTSAVVGAVLAKLAAARDQQGPPPLLLAPYISPANARRFIDEQFEFVDAAGNAHLNSGAAYVLVMGKKPERPVTSTEFTPADLKLIFALLANPRLLRAPYRELAGAAGVSLGKVSDTVRKLEATGYVNRSGSGALILKNPRRLLDRWEYGYLERLRPTLGPTTFRILGHGNLSQVIDSASVHAGVQVGGEHAAAMLTGHLKPATLTLHLPPGESRAMGARLKLARAPDDAEVFFLDRFDAPSTGAGHDTAVRTSGENLAHPILVRAELLALDDDRLREVAERLRISILAAIG